MDEGAEKNLALLVARYYCACCLGPILLFIVIMMARAAFCVRGGRQAERLSFALIGGPACEPARTTTPNTEWRENGYPVVTDLFQAHVFKN
jgi:hypothetical protein